ncbi:DHA2 family efflux MFS transporter permease subunit [Alkalibacillus salilacus]|uniref:EmrB/QacA subfamily drug resistance transporter n=1 Tax=Alkalibacillus salilacus TaxID=284582 RepID=A0ABT9VEW5_9BACI|nr:DHA2 family efflux MFS transporter permease subunit [Alkalibacillus salilacus]MDQ0159395.1 EmrB/QacA subfamily drug resistance transporter [Alkalibacillus salilacus]
MSLGDQQEKDDIKRAPLMLVLISGAFVAILNQTLLGTALPHIMRDLQIDESTAQWLQSIFMLVNGVMIPVTAFLIGRFTTRALFLTAIGSFAVGTLLCAIAPTFGFLLGGRILQAAGAGIILPLMQTIIFLIFPIEKRGQIMGLFGLVIAFAPAIGPTLSGWLVEQFIWRSLFWVVLPIAIIDIIVAFFILKNVTKRDFPKIDVLSIILSTLGFGGLLYGFSVAGNEGWGSPDVYISMVIGAITLAIFILRQLKLKQPILEFRIFQYKIFTIATVIGMTAFFAMIGGAIVLPLMMQNTLGYSPIEAGFMLMPGAVLMGMMNPITGRLFDKFGPKWLLYVGLTLMTVTTFMFSILTPETTYLYLVTVNAVRMFGIAMVMMPVTTAGLNVLPEHLIAHGSAMNNTFRQMSGAISTALMVTVMVTLADPNGGIQGELQGVNASFFLAGLFSLLGLVLAFYMTRISRKENQDLAS